MPKHKRPIYCAELEELPEKGATSPDYHSAADIRDPSMAPPIERDLMMHIFEDPECLEPTDEYTKLLPKRLHGPLPAGEPKGWGLQAVHRPYLAMIIGLQLAPCIVFFVVWLRFHPADISGAAAPPGLVFAFSALILAQLAYLKTPDDRRA